MGLVILPLLLIWLIATGYSLHLWYTATYSEHSILYALLALMLGTALAIGYSWLGLQIFKSKESIWAFEILFFFMWNKYSIAAFLLAASYPLWKHTQFAIPHAGALCFLIAFSLSLGTLIGSFQSESFVEEHEIRVTH
ncbi:hypothetical protein DU002_13250 [Corallincola holothuriorum]|uniref:Uncharacterized protein n=1 Tax=Corallincola holothuriorum TaxID=2282215 RepID=A0A368NEW6_9GAMM|nr:hypothetical protein [Corallincola holothuriorum]RCU48756.1 hypothetical protein DU002_13250 [Corallincola holothuriorum]